TGSRTGVFDVGSYGSAAQVGMGLAHWAARQPDVPAIISPHGDRTFRELNARANQLARALRALGLGPGDGVALLLANRPEFAEVVTACLRAGLRLTPINWHLTADEIAYIVGDCQARAFVADARFADVAREASDLVPGDPARLAVGGEVAGFASYDDAVSGEDPADLVDPVLGGTMLYTSGTTGRPKGVHRAQPPPSSSLAHVFGYEAGRSVHLCTGPLYHAAPLAFSLSAPLAAGAGVVLMDGW